MKRCFVVTVKGPPECLGRFGRKNEYFDFRLITPSVGHWKVNKKEQHEEKKEQNFLVTRRHHEILLIFRFFLRRLIG